MYLQKKDIKLLTIKDYYNNITMEYQKIMKLLDNTANQPAKFRTKNWVKTKDDPRGNYNADS